MKKVQNQVFPLASSTGRTALITGIVKGTVSTSETTNAIIHDLQPRRNKKPVVVNGAYFESVTAAAQAIVKAKDNYKNKDEYMKRVQCEQKRIAYKCNQDCWEGYFWSEKC